VLARYGQFPFDSVERSSNLAAASSSFNFRCTIRYSSRAMSRLLEYASVDRVFSSILRFRLSQYSSRCRPA
jgi:hypothetical protein